MRRFPIAPMNGVIRLLTIALVPLPLFFAVLGLLVPFPEMQAILLGCAGFILVIWLSIWVWFRPATFAVDRTGITLEFPGRSMHVPATDVLAARVISSAEMRTRYGLAMRIGAGGLWGGFGWLWTSERGTIDMYISRTDRFVVVERVSGRDLLITPDRAEEFVSAVAGRG